MVPDGLSIALTVAASCAVGVVLLGVAWALYEELARSGRSDGVHRKRGALICLEGGGHVAAGDVLKRPVTRRIHRRAVSPDDPAGRVRTSHVLRLIATTSSGESLARARRRGAGVRRPNKTDTVHQNASAPIGLHPLAG